MSAACTPGSACMRARNADRWVRSAVSMPSAVVQLGALLDGLVRRGRAKLTPDRAAYFCHPDWVADPALAPPADLWTPAIETRAGLRATAECYSRDRLL